MLIRNLSTTYLLLFIVLVSFIVRVWGISKHGPWHDERVTICIANGLFYANKPNGYEFTSNSFRSQNKIENVLQSTIKDNGNSIFYNVVLHYWKNVFGNSDFALRFLSVLSGLLLVFIGYRFSKSMFNDSRIGLLTAFLFAIQPMFIEDAQKIRAYAFATLLSFCSSYILLLIIKLKNNANSYYLFAGYVILATLSLLSHYLTSYILIAHFIIFVALVRDKHIWLKYIIAGACICLLFLCWLFVGGFEGLKVLEGQYALMADKVAKFSEGDDPYLMPVNTYNIVVGWVQVFLQIMGNSLQDFGLRIREIGALVFIPLGAIIVTLFKTLKGARRDKLLFLTIITFTQILYATLNAFREGHCRSFQTTYAVFASPTAIMLLAFAILYLIRNRKLKIIGNVILTFTVVTMFISIYPTYSDIHGDLSPRPENPYYNEAKLIEKSYRIGDTLYFNNYKDAMMVNLYLNKSVNTIGIVDNNKGVEIIMPR